MLARAVSPTPADVSSDQLAVIAQQQILIATQAQTVRDLEDALSLSPPPPTSPPAAPPAGTNADVIFTTQTAAIRTQAAYIQHLLDLAKALTPPGMRAVQTPPPPCPPC